ncbi:MAG: undecaprenyldiphospho-muramoylpentapeptide beta-N-acetylglucosaminyltransferase [Bacteroidota bacterium]
MMQRNEITRVLFAGGGTGGHLFPAIAMAEELKQLNAQTEIFFIGTKGKIESKIVPAKGYTFHTIWISGFQRFISLQNILFPLKVIVSLIQSFVLLKKIQPTVVVGTGGYVSGPVVFVASAMNIPTMIQEQNSYPGITTRLLSQRVNEVHISFEQTRKYFKKNVKVFVTGNPTRPELTTVTKSAAMKYFGFDEALEKKNVFLFGGSLGASSMNEAMKSIIDELVKKKMRVIWQTGSVQFEQLKHHCKQFSNSEVWIAPFIDNIENAYAVADVVIARSGATSLAEITRLGKATILVPYPFAAANHQEENAKLFLEENAAELISDAHVKELLLGKILSILQNDEWKAELETNCRRLGKPNAGKELAQRVLQLAKNKTRQ